MIDFFFLRDYTVKLNEKQCVIKYKILILLSFLRLFIIIRTIVVSNVNIIFSFLTENHHLGIT